MIFRKVSLIEFSTFLTLLTLVLLLTSCANPDNGTSHHSETQALIASLQQETAELQQKYDKLEARVDALRSEDRGSMTEAELHVRDIISRELWISMREHMKDYRHCPEINLGEDC